MSSNRPSRRRRTPRRHTVHTKDPRYKVPNYPRGTGDGIEASTSHPNSKSTRELQNERLAERKTKRSKNKPTREYRIYVSDCKHFGIKPKSWSVYRKTPMLDEYGTYLADIRQEGSDPISYEGFAKDRIFLSRASPEQIEQRRLLQRLQVHKDELEHDKDKFTFGDTIDSDYLAGIRPDPDGSLTVFRIGSEELYLEVDTLSKDDTDQMIEYIKYEDLSEFY